MLSRVVCFVCGSHGGVCSLHIQARDNGAYFPFLENHDPPKGARLPTSAGTIDACRVCYAFLLQQWESYERTKTPPVKRLYWLKRVDNGTFTGAEMRIQGEYAAQVMGLQYQPSGSGTLSPYDYTPPVNTSRSMTTSRKGVISPGGSSYIPPQPGYDDTSRSTSRAASRSASAHEKAEALDLSVMTPKPEPRQPAIHPTPPQESLPKRKQQTPPEPSPRSMEGSAIVCYVCAKEYPASLGRYIYAMKQGEDEPFFPFFYNIPPPKGSMPLTKNGLTKACSGCRKTLSRQWRYFDGNNVPLDQRVYQIDDKPVPYQQLPGQSSTAVMGRSSSRGAPAENRADDELCYLCEKVISKDNLEILQTLPPEKNSKYVMYFPFIAKLRRPNGARDEAATNMRLGKQMPL